MKDDNVSCIYGNENIQEKHLYAESTYISIPEVMMVRMRIEQKNETKVFHLFLLLQS